MVRAVSIYTFSAFVSRVAQQLLYSKAASLRLGKKDNFSNMQRHPTHFSSAKQILISAPVHMRDVRYELVCACRVARKYSCIDIPDGAPPLYPVTECVVCAVCVCVCGEVSPSVEIQRQ